MGMDGVTWVTCPHCNWYFKPGRGKEPECRCEYVLQDYDMNKEESTITD